MRNSMMMLGIAGLAAGSAPAWAGERAGDDHRASSAELAADAASRTSFLADGDTSVHVGGMAQFRYVMNFRDNPTSGAVHDSGFTNGFEATRTRLNFGGTVGRKDLSYFIEGQFGPNGELSLLDAFGRYQLDNRSSIRWGQFQLPIIRDYYIHPGHQLTVNNSVTTEVFAPGYSQGVMFDWRGRDWQWSLTMSDGIQAANTAYTDAGEADFALTARADYKPGGDWKRFDDFTSWRGEPNAWMVGAALHWENQGDTASTATVVQQQQWLVGVDAAFEGNGWNVYGGVIYLRTDPYDFRDTSDWGVILQGGVFATDRVEIFGRADGVFPSSERGGNTDEEFFTLTAGANYYLFARSHAAKFTADIQWFINEPSRNAPVSAVVDRSALALRPSTDDNQAALRVQFQIMF